MSKISKILVANRGEIACRIFRTCREMGIGTVAVYSDADASARHVREADQTVHLGGPKPQDSYLQADAIVNAALKSGADAVHPGYGFLSEDPAFAAAVIGKGLIWIGPEPESMLAMADKVRARSTVQAAGVPVVPGSEAVASDAQSAHQAAEVIGYPVMVKAAEGGGGIGMTTVAAPEDLERAIRTASEKAELFFGSARVYLEKFITSARHIEVQVLGLPNGTTVVVGDRDCTVQRRHQKVLEEAPAPGLAEEERAQLHTWAKAVSESVGYRGAGTVEMIMDLKDRSLYFLEMNTRLQVEHTVTELVSGIDLVKAQILVACGVDPLEETPLKAEGHAIEFRVYAEDPVRYLPGPGRLEVWQEPEGPGIRVDSGYQAGDRVTPYYDPLLAKLCVHGSGRSQAMTRLSQAADSFKIEGTKNNLPLVSRIVNDSAFIANEHDTTLLTKVAQ